MGNIIQAYPGKAKSVYILTSDKVMSETLVGKAKENQYKVWSVSEHADFLERLREYKPDAIVIDLMYTGTDVYMLLEQKMKDSLIEKIPVVAVYRDGIPVDQRRLASMNVDHTINLQELNSISIGKVFDALFELINGGSGSITGTSSGAGVGAGNVVAGDTRGVLANKKVLWVEDDKFLGDILHKKFTSLGAIVTRAKSADEALTHLNSDIPDCILLDILLPGMNGLDLLQKMRDDQALRNIPVMMLSNMNQPADLERARLLGAEKFLVKATVSLDQIVKEVGEILK